MKFVCQGVKATRHYLTVYVSIDYGRSMRFGQIKVPLELLLQDQVTEAIDSLVRARLRSVWEDDDALPGIG